MSQNPREADAMTKVQAELDETKIVLVSVTETVVSLLCIALPYCSHGVSCRTPSVHECKGTFLCKSNY